ncbi:pumilio homolog 3-like [Glandiceps talaboti]
MADSGKLDKKKMKRKRDESSHGDVVKKKVKKTDGKVDKSQNKKGQMKKKNEKKNTSDLEKKKQGYPKVSKKQSKTFSTKTKKTKQSKDKDDTDDKKLKEMTTKERKQVRRKVKNNYELAARAKIIWETVRRHDCSLEKRRKLLTELYSLVEGKAKELIFAHDTVRVIQCCVQFGSPEQRTVLFEELKDEIKVLSKNKYSKFYVIKMLKYGTKDQRDQIIKSFYGNVAKLVRHTEAGEVLESAYNNHANAKQRTALLEEFYGAKFAVFKTGNESSLGELLASHPEKKWSILGYMKEALQPVLDKSAIKHSIVHKALRDYFTYADQKEKADMIEGMREIVVQILHTHDGSRVAMQCIWNGTAKDRKAIIKSFKTFIVKICQEEYGHLALVAILDCVDDTKLVSKVILNEMLLHLSTLAKSPYGRKVLLYLLCGRDPSYCHPDVVKILQQGDNNPTSKKSGDIRHKELVQFISPGLLDLVVKETKTMAYDKSYSQLVLAVVQHAHGDKSPAMDAIATLAAEEFIPQLHDSAENLEKMHIVEHPAGHLLLKRLLQQDKDRKSSEQELFSSVLLNTVNSEYLITWAKVNRSAFVLCSLVENSPVEVKSQLVEILSPSLEDLRKINTKGTQVLVTKLDSESK